MKLVGLLILGLYIEMTSSSMLKPKDKNEIRIKRDNDNPIVAYVELESCARDDDILFLEGLDVLPHPVVVGESVELKLYTATTETVDDPIDVFIDAEALFGTLFDSPLTMKLDCYRLRAFTNLSCPIQACSVMQQRGTMYRNFITDEINNFTCPLERGLSIYENIKLELDTIPQHYLQMLKNGMDASITVTVNQRESRLACAKAKVHIPYPGEKYP